MASRKRLHAFSETTISAFAETCFATAFVAAEAI
jgi:hypothetical protein